MRDVPHSPITAKPPPVIAIVETGVPAGDLYEVYGGYPKMFRDAFLNEQADLRFDTVSVYEGAVLPELDAYDGYLITGSPLGVYEDHDFIPPLEAFIRQAIGKAKPTVGICFGHQIMARAFGAVVEKSDHGWGVGVHTYDLTEEARLAMPALDQNEIRCVVSHQDQVLSLSPEIKHYGGSVFCPNGVLGYGAGAGLSFQMHPEFLHDFADALLTSRENLIDKHRVQTARASFSGPTDRQVMLRAIAEFLETGINRVDAHQEKPHRKVEI